MNLEDIIDPEYGLQQDEWSLTRPKFGKEGQLEVIGWSGRGKKSVKCYILKCVKCSEDTQLFGEGYFKCRKGSLVSGCVPCGCCRKYNWSSEQYEILCSRKAKRLGYVFLGFEGDWGGNQTKTRLLCSKHGNWSTTSINSLLNYDVGCSGCQYDTVSTANKNPCDKMITSFLNTGAFHPDTKFCRSQRKSKQGKRVYWCVDCPECGEKGEAYSGGLQKGQRPCGCSKQRQQECYINWVVDDCNNAVAIKFGIARNSKQRIKSQDRSSIYEVRQHLVYSFPDVASCKKAERECKKELECGIVSKTDMKDGWTETTSVLNLGRVKSIYERNGGVLV